MAKPGEVANIVSQKQYDYFLKQALSTMPKVDKHHRPVGGKRANPLDSRGQPHRALRDQDGKVTQPGGGKADGPPSGQQALQAIMKFQSSGGKRDSLPKVSGTKNAARKDMEHAKMRQDKVVRTATRPPGSSEYEQNQMSQAGTKPVKGRYYRDREGRIKYQTPNQRAMGDSKEYLSKSISEKFYYSLDEALGL